MAHANTHTHQQENNGMVQSLLIAWVVSMTEVHENNEYTKVTNLKGSIGYGTGTQYNIHYPCGLLTIV